MDKDLWTRRSNTSKLSLNTPSSNSASNGHNNNDQSAGGRSFKRLGPDSATSSYSTKNPFNNISSPNTALPSPTAVKTSSASAFGLGSGAFASFGGGSKTPKTPGATSTNAFGSGAKTPTVEKAKDPVVAATSQSTPLPSYPLANSWVFWYRHVKSSTHNNASPQSYQDSIVQWTKPLDNMRDFFIVNNATKRPSNLPVVTEMHFFRQGVRPIWEDDENKDGGKWIIRLKKGVADRFWESLLFAIVGDQFGKADKKDDEVMGAVIAVRNGEDVLSLWLKSERSHIRIRDTLKRVLQCPANTIIEWRSHNESITQGAAVDAERKDRPQVDRQQSQRGASGTVTSNNKADSTEAGP